MDSAALFQNVFVPVFATKLASMGMPVRTDEDLQYLLKVAGQLKAIGVKSSVELRTDLYKEASSSLEQVIKNNVKKNFKKEAVAPEVLAGLAGISAGGGIASNDDGRGMVEKAGRGLLTGVGTVGGAWAGSEAAASLSDIISKKLKHSKGTADSTKSLIKSLGALLGGGAGYSLSKVN